MPPAGISTGAPAYGAKSSGGRRTAASASTRAVRTPLRESVIGPAGRAQELLDDRRRGQLGSRLLEDRDASPAAAGDAAEVPLKYETAPPRPAATQNAPGDSSDSSLAEFEKQTIVSGETDRSSQKGPSESPHLTNAKGLRVDGADGQRARDARRRRDRARQPLVARGRDEHDSGRRRRLDRGDVLRIARVAEAVVGAVERRGAEGEIDDRDVVGVAVRDRPVDRRRG